MRTKGKRLPTSLVAAQDLWKMSQVAFTYNAEHAKATMIISAPVAVFNIYVAVIVYLMPIAEYLKIQFWAVAIVTYLAVIALAYGIQRILSADGIALANKVYEERKLRFDREFEEEFGVKHTDIFGPM